MGVPIVKIAYFHCIGGISGDMVLGAVMDAGVPVGHLNKALETLQLEKVSISSHPGQRGGVTGTQAKVRLGEASKRPRRMQEFVETIQESGLGTTVIERACAILRRLEEAEAAVHRSVPEELHLHELGSVDTLVDVVGSVVGLEELGIERLYSSPLPTGSGIVASEHGNLPVPAPATAALFAMARAPVVPAPSKAVDSGEMVTPTGAAIVTTLADFREPAMNLERVGYGLGTKESPHYPNVLALRLGEEMGASYNTDLSLLETNIDDMSAELLAYVQERLFELGARDVWFTPIQMKKNRPATMLSALVPSDLESHAVTLIMKETTSLGVRIRPLARYEADRQEVNVETSLGMVPVKVKRLEGVSVAVSPEYEACRRIAVERGLPLQEVYRIIQHEAGQKLLSQ